MAKTSDYMDYLDSEIGIAPANSQEEFQAAETIVEVMKDHDLEPTIQEFDAHPLGALLPNILAVVMFVGVLLSGLGSSALRLLGLLLAIVPAILLLMRHLGHDVLSEAGPASRSQNVIAVHRASGDKVTKGNRPIVVIAHYDTPRESPLFERLAPYQARLRSSSVPCTMVAAVAALLQLFVFLPSVLRLVLWIVGLVAMVPAIVLAISAFVEKASPCTLGANDNKSSVAALLGLVDKVAPRDDRVSATSGPEFEDEASDNAIDGVTARAGDEGQVLGVRHGKQVLEELGILPQTCEIIYETTTSDVASLAQDDVEAEYADDGNDQMPAEQDEGMSSSPDSYGASPSEDSSGYAPDDSSESDDASDEQGAEPTQPDAQADEFLGADYDDAYEDTYAEEDAYPDETYTNDSAEDDEAWSEEAWGADAAPQQEGEESKAHSATKRVKGFFASLKDRLSSHGAKDAGMAIPRGSGDEGVDYSEFEETDWGDEGWNDETAEPQEELKSIDREELIARRNATKEPDAQDEADSYYEDDASYEQGEDEAYEADEGSTDEYAYDQDYAEEPETEETVDEPVPAQDGEVPSDEQESVAESRTSHDISHEDGPDWSIVEEDEISAAPAEPSTVDPAIYQQTNDGSDEEVDLGTDDLVEIEDELDEDQVASAPIKHRPKKAVPPAPAEPGATNDNATESDQPSQSDSDSTDDGRVQEAASEGEAALSWDEEEDQDVIEEDDVLPKDSRGLDTISDDYDAYQGDADDGDLEEPDPIDDPTWGETSYVPPRPKSNVARRATLYDVPSPSDETVDPLAEVDPDNATDNDASSEGTNGQTGTQGSEPNRARKWKGGAAVRSDLLGEDSQEPAQPYDEADDTAGFYDESSDEAYGAPYPEDDIEAQASDSNMAEDREQAGVDQDDLQDAILQMGDDLLISHDIWFVATGASSVDHAGVKAFLSDFRQDIRGAFLINLDSVGAGELTILTSEGLHEGRRADRRLVRLITNVADDLHLPLAKRPYDWSETDAAPAMRSRVRAVTIMGVDQNGLPALSHTADDTPENVNPKQVASVVRLVAEAIRRS